MKRWLAPASVFSLLVFGWLYVTYFSVEALPQIATGVNSQGGAFGFCSVDASGNNMTCPGTITAQAFTTSAVTPVTLGGLNGYAYASPPAASNDICAFTGGDIFQCEDSRGNFYQVLRYGNSGSGIARLATNGTLLGVHFGGNTAAPTGVVGTGGCTGGGSPSSTLTGTDVAGQLSVTTGTGTCQTNATLVTVTFATAYSTQPYCMIASGGGTVRALAFAAQPGVSQSAGGTGGFVVVSNGTALATGTTYTWNYFCIQ